MVTGTVFPEAVPGGPATATALAWDSANQLLYVAESNGVLGSLNVTTGKVVRETYLGGYLQSVAVDPTHNHLFVSDSNDGLLDVVSGATAKVLAQVPVGPDPMGVTFDPLDGMAYVAISGSNNLTAVNGTTYRTGGSLPAGVGPAWVTLDTRNNHLFVSDQLGCSATATKCNVTVVNASNSTIVATVAVGNSPGRLLFDNASDQVFVSVVQACRVAIIGGTSNLEITSDSVQFGISSDVVRDVTLDTRTNTIYAATQYGMAGINGTTHARLNLSSGNLVPDALAYAPTLDQVFASDAVAGGTDWPDATVYEFSPSNLSFGTGYFTYNIPGRVMYNSFNGLLYVEDATLNLVYLRNATSGRTVGSILGFGSGDMTYNASNGAVFVTQPGGIGVYNGTTNKRVEFLTDTRHPLALAFDNRSGELWALDEDGNVTSYDIATNTTTSTLSIYNRPAESGDILYDSTTNRVYAVLGGLYDQYSDGQFNFSEIDPSTHGVVTSVFEGAAVPYAMTLDPRNGALYIAWAYVAGPVFSGIDVRSAANLSYLGTISILNGTYDPGAGLTYAPSTQDVYMASGTGQLFPIDTNNNTVGPVLTVGGFPAYPCYVPPSRTIWVPDENAGEIWVVVP